MILDSVEYYAGVRVESLNVKEANSRKAVNSCWQLVGKGVVQLCNRVIVYPCKRFVCLKTFCSDQFYEFPCEWKVEVLARCLLMDSLQWFVTDSLGRKL